MRLIAFLLVVPVALGTALAFLLMPLALSPASAAEPVCVDCPSGFSVVITQTFGTPKGVLRAITIQGHAAPPALHTVITQSLGLPQGIHTAVDAAGGTLVDPEPPPPIID